MTADLAVEDPDFELRDTRTHVQLKGDYERVLAARQADLRRLQLACMNRRERCVLIFEGWDAGGKGGAIRRMGAVLEPRAMAYWSIGPPRPRWHGRHYLERFWPRLPEPGNWAVFDRSWYGRVLVERVEQLAPDSAWQRAYREINDFERMLLDDGVRIAKLFMHISPQEQLNRFGKRLEKPEKRWKITVDDIRNWEKREAYEAAVTDMVRRTSTPRAPWHVIPADSKKYARVKAMEVVYNVLSDGLDLTLPELDGETARALRDRLGLVLPDDI